MLFAVSQWMLRAGNCTSFSVAVRATSAECIECVAALDRSFFVRLPVLLSLSVLLSATLRHDEKAGSLTDALTAVRVEGSGVSGDVVNYLDFLGRLLIVLVVMI